MLINKNDLASSKGYKVFDVALPQSWVDECHLLGIDVRPHFVWCYDDSMFGFPAPLNNYGEIIINTLENKQ